MPPPGATGATPAKWWWPRSARRRAAGRPGRQRRPDAGPDRHQPRRPAGAGTRIAKTEQELAAARAIQARAAAPRTEQLPPLARRTTATSASPAACNVAGGAGAGRRLQRLQQRRPAAAQQQYDDALNQDPNNRDALLGAAAVAARQNQKDKAASYYLRLLELSPNDGAATAGLIGLRQGDISRSEARLKAILATNPEAAPVLFALGNLYAQQGRWPDAQQAYFRAYGAAPTIPTTPTTWPSAWTA
jgi:tetratricopeptide (TPR) repeat protein